MDRLSIRKSKKPLDQLCTIGVYFLFQDDEIVYVGKSTDIVGRIKSHIQLQDKLFDGWSFREYPAERIGAIESRFIRRLKPKYNIRDNDNYRYKPKPFANVRPRLLIPYYVLICQNGTPNEIASWTDSKGVYLGWWDKGLDNPNAQIFQSLWYRNTTVLKDVDTKLLIESGYQEIKDAVAILKNIHPIVRRMVADGCDLRTICAHLAIQDVIIKPFLEKVIYPEAHWWKSVEVQPEVQEVFQWQ
jgi:hypothetical protein